MSNAVPFIHAPVTAASTRSKPAQGSSGTTASPTLLFLQLNELNFPFIEDYANRGLLPNFARFFDRHGYVETVSESEHRLANPWIQWPTVHTGLDYKDHGVFRLGDIVKTNHPSIYDVLEDHGIKIAALGAFNARNSTRNPAFFVPDPWTKTGVTAPASVLRINDAIRQVTDDYAKNRISPRSIANLALGGLANLKWMRIPRYVMETARFASGKKWMRAVVGDRLLGDTFLTQCARHKPRFATLFLNGGAHLQHHYMFSSSAYKGENRNPEWIVPEGKDPLLDVLKLYDQLLGDTVKFANTLPDGRVMIATALHQEPHERQTFYYRLDDEAAFLRRMGIDFQSTYRLMTEDFVVTFKTEEEAAKAERMILDIESYGTDPIFYVETGDSAVRTLATSPRIFHIENRGKDLYVQWRPMSKAIPKGAGARRGDFIVENLDSLISFAQYKNTHHHGIGYFSDSGYARGELPNSFPLRDIYPLILAGFGIRHPRVDNMTPALASVVCGRSNHPTAQAA